VASDLHEIRWIGMKHVRETTTVPKPANRVGEGINF
jgi:hypothetical protein